MFTISFTISQIFAVEMSMTSTLTFTMVKCIVNMPIEIKYVTFSLMTILIFSCHHIQDIHCSNKHDLVAIVMFTLSVTISMIFTVRMCMTLTLDYFKVKLKYAN